MLSPIFLKRNISQYEEVIIRHCKVLLDVLEDKVDVGDFNVGVLIERTIADIIMGEAINSCLYWNDIVREFQKVLLEPKPVLNRVTWTTSLKQSESECFHSRQPHDLKLTHLVCTKWFTKNLPNRGCIFL